ncbi:MAG: PTS sugar transporter subunit IIB [Firmicutes bacterium]|nr:PTS sugar transporter subunit IIB [Bacillota bacterium]
MEIVLTRIDDRLIHGQITTTWLRQYKCDTIFVVDNQVANDPLLKRILKSTAPADIRVEALTADRAADIIINNTGNSSKVMIITKRPAAIVRLVERGVEIKNVNVGGMQPKQGSKKISKAVSVTEDDIRDFNALLQQGIKVEIRMIPTDKEINLANLI